MIEALKINNQTKELAVFLEANKSYILKKWEEREFVNVVLHSHDIEPAFFVNHFGKRVLEYFIEVLNGQSNVGTCPAIVALLMFFRQKNIKLHEVFICCAAFKNVVIGTIIDKKGGIRDHELDIVSFVFDLNFAGVIQEYLQKRYCRINCVEEIKKIHEPLQNTLTADRKEQSSPKTYQVYASEYDRMDIDEFIDLEADIISLSDQLNFGSFNAELVAELGAKLSKYGSIILTNYNFNAIGNHIIHLAALFEESENHRFIADNIRSLIIFIDCFVNDLVLWRKSLLETGIENPHYFDQSIISNVEQIIQMVQDKQDIDEGEGFEFF